jgi:phosphatidylserine synthase
MATSSVLDKKFVGGAIALGLAYALIIVALDHFIGKEAAGVAGVALTALAGAIFKQFETLRFRQIQEHEATVVLVPRLYSWYLLLLIFSFYGLPLHCPAFTTSALAGL